MAPRSQRKEQESVRYEAFGSGSVGEGLKDLKAYLDGAAVLNLRDTSTSRINCLRLERYFGAKGFNPT